MRRRLVGLFSILAMGAAAAPALAEGNANFVLGVRALGDDDWEPVEEHAVLGVTVDFGKENWPIHLAAGYMGSRSDEEESDLEIKATIRELSFGVLKVWDSSKTRPFLGGGLAMLNAEIEVQIPPFFLPPGFPDRVTLDDNSPAFYAQGGVFWRFGSRFNLGFDARALFGSEFETEGLEADADYFQAGLLLGWGWPAE